MASNAVVGVLRALLTADTAQFDTGMRKSSVVAGNFDKQMKGVEASTKKLTPAITQLRGALGALGIAFSAGAIINFAREAVRAGSELVDLAAKTGENTDSLQRMKFVADQTGSSFETMTNAAVMLRQRLASGNDSVLKALNDLRQASGNAALTTRSSADEILRALSSVEDAQERLRLGTVLFGRSFREFASSVNQGYAEMSKGAVIATREQLEALDQLGDLFSRVSTQIRNTIIANAGELARWGLAIKQAIEEGGIFQSTAAVIARAQELLAQRRSDIQLPTEELVETESDLNEVLVKQKKAVDDLLPVYEQYFTLMQRVLPAIEANNASQEVTNDLFNEGFEGMQRYREELDRLEQQLRELGMAQFDFTAHVDNQASREAADIAAQQAEDAQKAWDEMIENISTNLTMSISDALADTMVGLRSFKEAFVDIWRSIRRAVSNILATMLDEFIKGFIGPVMRKLGAFVADLVGLGQGAGGGSSTGGQPWWRKALGFAAMALPFILHSGGMVPNSAGGQEVVAKLLPGEGVLSRSATAMIGGPHMIDALNASARTGTPSHAVPPPSPMPTMSTMNITIQAWDGADVKRVLEREVWPRFNREAMLNQHGVGSSIKRAGR